MESYCAQSQWTQETSPSTELQPLLTSNFDKCFACKHISTRKVTHHTMKIYVLLWDHKPHTMIIRIENPRRCHNVSKFYFIFIWSSTCFRQNTAHHQERKTALAASGFAYVESCWTCGCWTLSGRAWQRPATTYKYKIQFWYIVASCWIFYTNYTVLWCTDPQTSSLLVEL